MYLGWVVFLAPREWLMREQSWRMSCALLLYSQPCGLPHPT
jgi:hypothetical protein